MFGLFKTDVEKNLRLVDFLKWAKKAERILNNPHQFMLIKKQILFEYNKLTTLEQKLYAAYTSFSSNLKDTIKGELEEVSPERKEEALRAIYEALEEMGKHGCSSLLKQDYKEFFSRV